MRDLTVGRGIEVGNERARGGDLVGEHLHV